MNSDNEWCRSRFWLGHFLYTRHAREPIDGHEQSPPGHPAEISAWCARLACAPDDADRWLVSRAARDHGYDPAFVQALRLVARERQHHRHLFALLAGPTGTGKRRRGWPRLANLGRGVLGARFALSVRLLEDLNTVVLLARLEPGAGDAPLGPAVRTLLREKRTHLAFVTERLTAQYADFNFVRRNLRRLRLRLMCAASASATAWRHGGEIRAVGVSRARFIHDVWRQFAALLEQMVPYRREALLAALLSQREQPYREPLNLP